MNDNRRVVSVVPYGRHFLLTLTCGHQSVIAASRRDIIADTRERLPVHCNKCERSRLQRIWARWRRLLTSA